MSPERRAYRAWFEGDDTTGWGVSFPDFPGCVAAGDIFEEARAMAAEALAFHIEGMAEDGDPLPEPSSLADPVPDWMGRDGPGHMVPVEVESAEAE